jgi:hypothetical protein
MTIENKFDSARRHPGKLEALYREMRDAGESPAFMAALANQLELHPGDTLLQAWACRLDIGIAAPREEPAGQLSRTSQSNNFIAALIVSVVLAFCYVLISRGGPPAPVPGEARPMFWLGWSPLAALAMLIFLAWSDRSPGRLRRYAWPAVAVAAIGLVAAVRNWSNTGPVAELIAMHLPFAVWAAVGIGLCAGRDNPYGQGYAFMIKSLETVMAGGIYLGSLAVFAGLTNGIFDVIGIELAEEKFQWVLACGIGIVPVMALASCYQPSAAPADQGQSSGLAGIVAVIARLILPLALGVLLVYLLWFIPAYFERPFQERGVLIVYNATILAVLVLLAVVVQETGRNRLAGSEHLFRYAVVAMTGLTLLLNVYALAAILYRTLNHGLTPNRYACLGWNAVTLLILAGLLLTVLRSGPRRWSQAFQLTLARLATLAAIWALWVAVILPLWF